MRKHRWLTTLVFGGCLVIAAGSIATPSKRDPYEVVNENWDRFGAVYKRVLQHYYDDLDHGKLMRAAIEGMLRELDSYSQYFDAEGLRQLRQDTTGKFAGLGITVGIKDHYPVVIAPMEGTPAQRAGLQPGDLILAIENDAAFDLTLEQVVNTLRGEPGSTVTITIARQGESPWDVAIKRELIKIKSVALADEIAPGIGYVSMRRTRFSEDTASEVEEALKRMMSADIDGLVFDLRGNPGGLLSQAAQVADLFLAKSDPIVSIRERDGGRGETRYSQRRPAYSGKPLVVLIDGGSASAAEIVAGAIQDNDRGLLVGTTSFGKGSVQTIFDLRQEMDSALKLTTALYYTPSGRSIHRRGSDTIGRLSIRVPFGDSELPAAMLLGIILAAEDQVAASAELRARFEMDNDEAREVLQTRLGDLVGSGWQLETADGGAVTEETYQTRNGRSVFGGGGITPDIVVESTSVPHLVQQLRRRRLFFDFVVDYVGATAITAEQQPQVDDVMLDAFRAFVPDSLWAAAHEGASRELEALRRNAERAEWGKPFATALDSLEAILTHVSAAGFRSETERLVRANLRRELALRLHGKRASLLVDLAEDPQVEEAVGLIRDPQRFRLLLDGG